MYLYPAMVFIPTAKYVCSKKSFEIQMAAAAAHQVYAHFSLNFKFIQTPQFSDTGYLVHIYRTVDKEWVHVVR